MTRSSSEHERRGGLALVGEVHHGGFLGAFQQQLQALSVTLESNYWNYVSFTSMANLSGSAMNRGPSPQILPCHMCAPVQQELDTSSLPCVSC